jgi:hypothetical protein
MLGMDHCGVASDDDVMEAISETFLGKLKSFCPILFHKLSSWERDYLGNVVFSTVTSTLFSASKEKNSLSGYDQPCVSEKMLRTLPVSDTILAKPIVTNNPLLVHSPPMENVLQ